MSVKLILVPLFLYFIYAGIFFLFQRKVIYPTSFIPVSNLPTRESSFEKYVISSGANSVEAFFFPAKGSEKRKRPLMIIAHGNASLIDFWVDLLDLPQKMGINILLVEYPGYGRSTGKPSQQSITAVFVKAYDRFLVDKRVDATRIVFLGRSLGGGVACSLARMRTPAALILCSTFTSVRSFTGQYFLPGFLASDPYDNLDFLSRYSGPLMLVHGTQDRTIPINHSEKLRETRPDAFWVTYRSDHNNTPPDWNDFWTKVGKYLKQSGIL